MVRTPRRPDHARRHFTGQVRFDRARPDASGRGLDPSGGRGGRFDRGGRRGRRTSGRESRRGGVHWRTADRRAGVPLPQFGLLGRRERGVDTDALDPQHATLVRHDFSRQPPLVRQRRDGHGDFGCRRLGRHGRVDLGGGVLYRIRSPKPAVRQRQSAPPTSPEAGVVLSDTPRRRPGSGRAVRPTADRNGPLPRGEKYRRPPRPVRPGDHLPKRDHRPRGDRLDALAGQVGQ